MGNLNPEILTMELKRGTLIYSFLIPILLVLTGCSKKEVIISNAGPVVTDVDGNVYHSIKIGTQTWMVENLKTTKYRNGDLIGTTTLMVLPRDNSSKYQWAYDNKESNATIYGRLYTWYAATDTRSIAPAGWHVPNSREWMILINYLGGTSLAGGKLKAKGESFWKSPNFGASNDSGFTALPGGFWSGIFYQLGETANWWSVATPSYIDLSGDFFGVGYGFNGVSVWEYPMENGLSVRCVQD